MNYENYFNIKLICIFVNIFVRLQVNLVANKRMYLVILFIDYYLFHYFQKYRLLLKVITLESISNNIVIRFHYNNNSIHIIIIHY